MGKAEVEISWQALLRMTVQRAIFQLREQTLTQALPHPFAPASFLGQSAKTQLASLAEANDAGNSKGSAAHAAFVAATVEDRFQTDASTDVKSADAFRAVHFVGGQAEQVGLQRCDIDRN